MSQTVGEEGGGGQEGEDIFFLFVLFFLFFSEKKNNKKNPFTQPRSGDMDPMRQRRGTQYFKVT